MIKRASTLAVVLAVIFAAHSLLLASVPQVQSGQWAPIQPDPQQAAVTMLQARDGAAAVLLPNDRVLIIGGAAADGTALSSAEVFTAQGEFLPAGSMNIARKGHTATLLENGRVLIAGGTTATGDATATVEIYELATDTWTLAGALQSARSSHTATMVKLLNGGQRVVIAGGESNGVPVGSLEMYNGAIGAVDAAGALGTPRMGHAAARMSDGRVAIFGGSDGTAPVATTEIFNPQTLAIGAGPDMPQARKGAAAVTLLNGGIFIVGGNDGTQDLASALRFDGIAFTSAGTLSMARQRPVAVLLPHNNGVLVFGGTLDGGAAGNAELYRPWSNTIVRTGLPTGLRSTPVTSPLALDGLLLAGGGDATDSAELYGFATIKTDLDDYAPGTRVTITGSGWQPFETVTMYLEEIPVVHEELVLQATADANGNFTNDEFFTEDHDLYARFYLTAYGGASEAQTTFTDAGKFWVGCADTSWGNNNNWSLSGTATCTSGVPSSPTTAALAADTATITSGRTFYPDIRPGAFASVQSLTINAGGSVTVSGGSLSLSFNHLINNGTLTITSGTVTSIRDFLGSGTTIMSGGLLRIHGNFALAAAGVANWNANVTGGTVEFAGSGDGNQLIGVGADGIQFYGLKVSEPGDGPDDTNLRNGAKTIRIAQHLSYELRFFETTDTIGGTAVFNGSSAQIISWWPFGSPPRFNNLTVNNPAGVTLSGSGPGVIVNNALTFTSGNINTQSLTLTVGTNATSGTVSATGGYVVGRLKKFVANSIAEATKTFEVGTASFYTPLTFTPNADLSGTNSGSSLIVRAISGEHPSIGNSGINQYRDVNSYWNVSGGGPLTMPAAGYKLKGQFVNPGGIDAGADTSLFITMPSGSSPPTRTSTTTEASFTFAGLVGDFAIGEPTGGATTTTVVTSGSPSVFGQSVTFTATVVNGGAPVAEGQIEFRDGGSNCSTGTVVQAGAVVSAIGEKILATSSLSSGSHAIRACYLGTTNFAASAAGSGTVVHTVNKANTTTSLTVAPLATSTYGQQLTLTAAVAAVFPGSGTATGTVTFKDGAVSIGSVTLSGGQASMTISTLDAGPHSLMADYGGGGNFNNSTSSTANHTVTQLTPSFNNLTASQSIAYGNPSVTLSGTISAVGPFYPTAGETVLIAISGVTIPASIGAGGAFSVLFDTRAIPAAPLTPYTITYSYAGNTNFTSANNTSTTLRVNKATQRAVAVTAPISVTYGTTGTATATGGDGTGAYTFSAGVSTGCNVLGNQVSVTDATLTCALTATRAGDSNHEVSAPSASFPVTLHRAASTVTVTCTGAPYTYTGSAQEPCSATVTGVGGLNESVTVTYTNNVHVGIANASATYAGDANHESSSDTETFNITTGFCFTGFLQPIGGSVESSDGGTFSDPVRAFKLGSTIPVKFLLNSLIGSTCGPVVTAGIHTLQAIKYTDATDSDAPIDATPTDAGTTGNQFRLTGTEWHFNLNTNGNGFSVGTWVLRATLADGTVKTVWITIKE